MGSMQRVGITAILLFIKNNFSKNSVSDSPSSCSVMIRKQRLLTLIDTGIYFTRWIRTVSGVECFCVSKFKTQIVTWTKLFRNLVIPKCFKSFC